MRMPNRIMGPRHIHPGVSTADDYRRWHAQQLAALKATYPNLPLASAPWPSLERPLVGVSGGKAVIECATPGCHNFPGVAVEWGGLACCVDCGAVYDGLEAPERWSEICAVLAARPERAHRHWDPTAPPVPSVEDLVAWNRACHLPAAVEAEG